jgi:hypothetical protein
LIPIHLACLHPVCEVDINGGPAPADVGRRRGRAQRTEVKTGKNNEGEMTKLVTTLLVVLGTELSAADLAGRWTLSLDPDFSGNPDTLYCTLKQSGEKLTMDCGDSPISGEVKDQNVTFRFKAGDDGRTTATMSGALDDAATTVTGKWHLDPDNRDGNFQLKRR